MGQKDKKKSGKSRNILKKNGWATISLSAIDQEMDSRFLTLKRNQGSDTKNECIGRR